MLSRPGLVDSLVKAGLDHADNRIVPPAGNARSPGVRRGAWEETVRGLGIAGRGLLRQHEHHHHALHPARHREGTMRFLIDMGVRNIAFNGLIRSGKGKEAEGISPTR